MNFSEILSIICLAVITIICVCVAVLMVAATVFLLTHIPSHL